MMMHSGTPLDPERAEYMLRLMYLQPQQSATGFNHLYTAGLDASLQVLQKSKKSNDLGARSIQP
jgi:hypothetical protein